MLTIRQANPTDLPLLLTFDILSDTLLGRKELHTYAVTHGATHVAYLGEQLVGFIILTYQLFGNGFIELLQIGSEWRGQGYGKELLLHAENICTTDKLFISTTTSNKVMNILLPKLGYLPAGHLEYINEEPWDHEVFYVKLKH